MKIKTYFLLLCASTLSGIVLFAFFEGWITIHIPQRFLSNESMVAGESSKKITLTYWTPQGWQVEQTTLMWTAENEKMVEQLLNGLFMVLYESHTLKKRVHVNAIMVGPSGHELFISTDHLPFNKDDSVYAKWMHIESILKMLKDNGIKVSCVRFLVNHEPANDRHLDLSFSWPLHGFLR